MEQFYESIRKLVPLFSVDFAAAIGVATFFSLVVSLLEAWPRLKSRASKVSLSDQLASTFSALDENSKKATELLSQLQSEISERSKAVQEIEANLKQLEQRKTLLELSDEQKKAIESLIQRQPSAREIFSSLDFWLGRVLPGSVFFVLGVGVTLLLRG